VHNYLTEPDIQQLKDKLLPVSPKLRIVVLRVVDCGCRYPSEETIRNIVALVGVLSEIVDPTPAQLHEYVLDVKKHIKAHAKGLPSSLPYLWVYPEYPGRLPAIYYEAGYPAAAPVSLDLSVSLARMDSQVPLRMTNKSLAAVVPNAAQAAPSFDSIVACGRGPNRGVGSGGVDMAGIANMLLQLVSASNGGSPHRGSNPNIRLTERSGRLQADETAFSVDAERPALRVQMLSPGGGICRNMSHESLVSSAAASGGIAVGTMGGTMGGHASLVSSAAASGGIAVGTMGGTMGGLTAEAAAVVAARDFGGDGEESEGTAEAAALVDS
jgi:hypothetical protein